MTNRDDLEYMKSQNFEFLRIKWNELASLGGFAEAYAQPDPIASLVKLRTFCEQFVEFIYTELRLPRFPKTNLYDLLESDAFKSIVPRVVVAKLHALRIHGNHAAHGDNVSSKTALWLLRESHDLGKWLLMTYGGGALADISEFVEPPAGGIEGAERRREKRAVLERLAAQEAQMQQLLSELEAVRTRALAAEANVAELQVVQTAATTAGRHAVDVLSFDEATTRRKIIDAMLADAGWNLDDPEQVKREVEVRDHAHIHVITRYQGDVGDPRGGVRWVIPEKAAYWKAPS